MNTSKIVRATVVGVDKDYNSVVSEEILEFQTIECAEDFVKRESWSGVRYFISEVEVLP